jgi:hypothetical protein
MTNFEKPLDSPGRGLSRAHGFPSAAAIKTAVLVALLIAYGLGFAALYPLVQTSAAKNATPISPPLSA